MGYLVQQQNRNLNAKIADINGRISAATENGIVRILMYNSHLPENHVQPVWNERLSIDIANGEYIVTETRIEEGHGSPYEAWIQMGMPQSPTR